MREIENPELSVTGAPRASTDDGLVDKRKFQESVGMGKESAGRNTGRVGRRGSIVLSAATLRRYGLKDGSLFISEERDDGVLIRPAKAIPADFAAVRRKIRVGLDQLDRGEGIPGEEVEAELKRASTAFRAKKK